MSTTETSTKATFDTILKNIRREAGKIREANDKLRDLMGQLRITEHPAPGQVLDEATVTIGVGLAHIKDVFREF